MDSDELVRVLRQADSAFDRTAKSIAGKLGLGVGEVERELERLVLDGVLAVTQTYWLNTPDDEAPPPEPYYTEHT